MAKRMRAAYLATAAVAAIGWSGSARADCTTTTPAGGPTTILCPEDTTTTPNTNTNPNNPATRAREQRFNNNIVTRVTAGTDITGFGLWVTATGANQSILFENNGTITNSGTNPDPDFIVSERGVQLRNLNGGNITYTGNGSVTTTNPAVALTLLGRNTGSLNIGSAAAPVTGTFSGRTGISATRFVTSGQTPADAPIEAVNVFLQGGSMSIRPSENVGVGIAIEAQDANINVVTTGNTVINTTGGGSGMVLENLQINSQRPMTINVSTDARFGSAASRLNTGISSFGFFSNQKNSTNIALTGTGAIFALYRGISAQESEGGGDVRITTSAASIIDLVPGPDFDSIGISGESAGLGSVTIDVGGSVAGAQYGIRTFQDTGALDVTIRAGATVSGSLFGIDYFRYDDVTGPSNILVLGTLSSPQTAARFIGTLQVGNGGTSGALSGNVVNGGALIFNRSDASSYAGIVSGPGSLRKTGAGSLTLSGASTYTGGTTVDQGILLVNGSIVGTTQVGAGGTLGGTGRIANGTFAGTIAPGSNAIGTLTTTGNVTLASGSTFQVEVDQAGASDRLAVGGTATLQGGTVSALFLGGQSNQCGAPITSTILTAQGGVTGTFSGVTANFAFLTPSFSYTANNVSLTLTRNAAAFSERGATVNQRQSAAAAEALKCGNALFNPLVQLSSAQAQAAFEQISGEMHASTRGALADDSRFLREAMLADHGDGRGLWAHGYGSWGEIEGDGNAGTVDREASGLFGGIDLPLGDAWSAGVVGGYSRTEFAVDARNSEAEVDSWHFGGRIGGRLGAVRLTAGAAASWHSIDTARAIAFTGFTDAPTARYDGRTLQLFARIGYELPLGASSTIEPFADAASVEVETDGFNETGGASAVTAEEESEGTGFTSLGVRGRAALGRVALTGSAAWRHAFNVDPARSRLTFPGGAAAFTVTGAPIAEDALALEAGMEIQLGGTARLGISYAGQLADRTNDHGARAVLSFPF